MVISNNPSIDGQDLMCRYTVRFLDLSDFFYSDVTIFLFRCQETTRKDSRTQEQKANNRTKSKVRCRIEHIFGMMKMHVGNEVMRYVGKAGAVFQIGMRNFIYNVCRYVSLAGKC
jgi:hypothetical protein